MKPIRSTSDLVSLIQSGGTPRYLFFWGHTPSHDGTITKSCLSQWWESPFEVDEDRYLTAEHYMMAAKARLFGDKASHAQILNAEHPKKAKNLGRIVTGFNESVWLRHRYDIVVTANEAKFRQNDQLSNFLLSTGERILVEASPLDKIWGIGLTENDAKASSPQHWQGLNLLEFALMEARERLRTL